MISHNCFELNSRMKKTVTKFLNAITLAEKILKRISLNFIKYPSAICLVFHLNRLNGIERTLLLLSQIH